MRVLWQNGWFTDYTTVGVPVQQSDMPVTVSNERRRLEDEWISLALSAEIVGHLNFAANDGNQQKVSTDVSTFLYQHDSVVRFSLEPDFDAITALTC